MKLYVRLFCLPHFTQIKDFDFVLIAHFFHVKPYTITYFFRVTQYVSTPLQRKKVHTILYDSFSMFGTFQGRKTAVIILYIMQMTKNEFGIQVI